MILAIRTDKPEAELYVCEGDGKVIGQVIWQAHKELSVTILEKMAELIESNGFSWSDVTAIVVYEGPGSFTGLRIGITVANTIAYAQNIPIVGATGSDWIAVGVEEVPEVEVGQYIMPEYGGEANITTPRK